MGPRAGLQTVRPIRANMTDTSVLYYKTVFVCLLIYLFFGLFVCLFVPSYLRQFRVNRVEMARGDGSYDLLFEQRFVQYERFVIPVVIHRVAPLL